MTREERFVMLVQTGVLAHISSGVRHPLPTTLEYMAMEVVFKAMEVKKVPDDISILMYALDFINANGMGRLGLKGISSPEDQSKRCICSQSELINSHFGSK